MKLSPEDISIKAGPRCKRCRKRWRVPRYYPFCSYQCEEWAMLEKVAADCGIDLGPKFLRGL